MDIEQVTEEINCPFCNGSSSTDWATENGFTAVKCSDCSLIYVNPRPKQALISEAVKTGNHREVEGGHNVVTRRRPKKVATYKKIISEVFADVWRQNKPISWLDIGAGYGEIIEAITALASQGSSIEGIEPMRPKVEQAKKLGLKVRERYLSEVTEQYNYVSLFNVFSHIPDFRSFLLEMKKVIKDQGELLIETGNIADLRSSEAVPNELNLPDHLIFAGEKHYVHYLEDAGFHIVSIKRERRDGLTTFCKLLVKKILGRRVFLRLPYTSEYRTFFIRAKLEQR